MTTDETLVHHFQPETKRQSKQWKHLGSLLSKEAKNDASIFWDAEGLLLIDYLDKGHTITGAYYAYLLRQLWEKIKQIQHRKLTRGVLFHQDNTLTHTSTVAMAAIQKCGFQLVEDPHHSPDFALPENDHHFARDDDVLNAVDHFLMDQNGTFYHLLHDQWTKCINVIGE